MMPRAEISSFKTVRERTVSWVSDLSQEDMGERPVPDRWSIGEVLDHLLRSELLWRGEIDELVRLARSRRQPFLSRLITDLPLPVVGRLPAPLIGGLAIPLTMLSTVLPLSLFLAALECRRIPAQAPPTLTPRRGRSAAALRQSLVDQAAATIEVLENNQDLRFDRLLYQHPFLGIVNAIDLLRVITAHEKRHQKQLTETLTALGVRGRP